MRTNRISKTMDIFVLLLSFVLPISIAGTNILGGAIVVLFLLGVFFHHDYWPLEFGFAEKGYLLFIAISFLSVCTAVNPLKGLHEIYKKDFYYIFPFLLVPVFRRRPMLADRSWLVFLLSSLLTAAFGIMQFVLQVDQNDNHGLIVSVPSYLSHVSPKILDFIGLINGRAAGTRSHPLSYAGCLLFALAIAIHPVLAKNRISWRRWLAVSLLIGSLIVSQSRGPWIAALVMVGVHLLIVRPRRMLRLVLLLGPIWLLFQLPIFHKRAETIVDKNFMSNTERLRMWHVGWLMVQERPFLGFGPGSVKLVSPQFQEPVDRIEGPWGHLHNSFIHIAAERGLLGMVFFVIMMGSFLYELIRACRWPIETTPDADILLPVILGILGFLVSGLTQTNYNDAVVIMTFYFCLAHGLARARGNTR